MRIRRVPTARFPPVRPHASPARRSPGTSSKRSGAAGATKRGRGSGRSPGGTRPLVGKRLAAAAHPIARRLDPARAGFGPRDLLAAVRAAGLRLDGDDDGYMALYTALNASSGLFARAERGRYVWLELEEATDRPTL